LRVVSWRFLVLIALAGALAFAGVSAADTPPNQPGGSANISYPSGEESSPGSNMLIVPSGTGQVTISWNGSCPVIQGDNNPQYWSWYIQAGGTYADGSRAFDSGPYYAPLGSTSWGGQQGFSASIRQGDQTETISWTVQLYCGSSPSSPQTLGSGSFKLERCDPGAYNKAQSEFAEAAKLQALGEKELAQSKQGLEDFAKDFVKESVEIGAEKSVLLKALKLAISHGPVVVIKVAASIIGTIVAAQQFEVAWQDYARLANGAKDDFALAQLFTDKANADLKRGGPCLDPIDGQLNKLLKDQKREDAARRIIDGWENNGYQYVSPISHELVDENTALKQAKAALTAGKQATDATAKASASQRSVTATAAQLRTAIHYIDQALGIDRRIRRQLAHLESATKKAVTRLKALLG
jgi:hypothetical protein